MLYDEIVNSGRYPIETTVNSTTKKKTQIHAVTLKKSSYTCIQ